MPGDGDTVTINHAVSVDENTTWGTGGSTGIDEIIVNAPLSVDASVTLTYKGDIKIFTGGSFYCSGSLYCLGTYILRVWTGAIAASFVGTAGNRASFSASPGNWTQLLTRYSSALSLTLQYCDSVRIGNSGNFSFTPNGSNIDVAIDESTFDYCGRMVIEGTWDGPQTTSTFSLTNSVFTNGQHSLHHLYSGSNTINFPENSRVISGNKFAGKGLFVQHGGTNPWIFTNNFCDNVPLQFTKNVSAHGNVLCGNVASLEAFIAYGPCDCYDNIYFSYGNNGHGFQSSGTEATDTQLFHDNICESLSATTDTTNFFLPTEGSTPGPRRIYNNIGIGANMVVLRGVAASPPSTALDIYNNTHVAKSYDLDAFLVEEGQGDYLYTGEVNLYNNIEYSLSGNDQLLVKYAGALNADNNCIYDKIFDDRYDTGVTVTGGTSDIGVDPVFSSPVGLLDYDSAQGGSGNITSLRAGFLSGTYDAASVIVYFGGKYAPTNADLSDGYGTPYLEYIGAVEPVLPTPIITSVGDGNIYSTDTGIHILGTGFNL